MVGEKCGVGGHDFMSNRDLLDVMVNQPHLFKLQCLCFHIYTSVNIIISSPVHVWLNGLGEIEGFPLVARHD